MNLILLKVTEKINWLEREIVNKAYRLEKGRCKKRDDIVFTISGVIN